MTFHMHSWHMLNFLLPKISTIWYNNVRDLGHGIKHVHFNTAVDLFPLHGQVPALPSPH